MKIEQYLKDLPIGTAITSRRTLALFKRMGLLYDYSKTWGYLETCFIKKTDEYGIVDGISYKPAPKNLNRPLTSKEYYNGGYMSLDFTYKGMRFKTRYLDGCFNAYLYKAGGITTTEETVNPRMSLFGTII